MNKIQVVTCKCNKHVVAYSEPDCYLDKDWYNQLREYIEKGYKIEIISGDMLNFGECECKKIVQGKLF